ncbi:MAG: cytochrome c oxidase assembly protein [Methylococcales bacterium]|nr:cytochrome c oxidase assembly protein [Methylococcales bacterium]
MIQAWTHEASHHAEHGLGWNFEPWLVLPLLAVAVLYSIDSVKLYWRGRQRRNLSKVLFWAGFATIAFALISPLHAYGSQVFWLHMVEHELLMVIGVPLIVFSQPGTVLIKGMPNSWRRSTIRVILSRGLLSIWHSATELGSATVLHTAILWLWHLPILFRAALDSEALHSLQHVSFMVSAGIFWTAILNQKRKHYGQGMAALALFFTSLQASFWAHFLPSLTGFGIPKAKITSCSADYPVLKTRLLPVLLCGCLPALSMS